jgi:putative membrane protein
MRRLHRLSAAIDAARGGLQVGSFALFGTFILAGRLGAVEQAWAALLVPLGVVLGASYQVAYYYRFTYELTDEELVVASGVVGRQKREIPLDRIQNVDVRRPAIKRLLGLAIVTFETAGGSSTEATLDAVSTAEAKRLQREAGPRARRRRAEERTDADAADPSGAAGATAGPGAAGAEQSDSEPGGRTDADAADDYDLLYAISDRELGVLSAVSFRPGAFAVPFVGVPFGGEDALVFLARQIGIDLRAGVRDFATMDPLTITGVVIGVILSYLLAVWIVSVVLTYVQYYDFRLERHGDELRYERGLVGRYSGTIPLDKVQTVTVGENILMRRVGYAALAVETAGYAPGSNGGGGGSETTVPLAARERVVTLAQSVLAATDETGRFETGEAFDAPDEPTADARRDTATPVDGVTAADDAPVANGDVSVDADTAGERPVVDPSFERPAAAAEPRYTRRYLIALGILVAAVAGVASALSLPLWIAAFPVVLAPLTPFAARRKWENRGYHETDWSLLTRDGYWRRHTRIVPAFRLQNVIVTRTIFQRRWGLASVTADTASSASVVGGDATVYDIAPDRADEIRAALLDRLDDALAARKRVERERAERERARRERRQRESDERRLDGESDEQGLDGESDEIRPNGGEPPADEEPLADDEPADAADEESNDH